MPVGTEVQQKVVQLTTNDAVPDKTKLAVRKRFYELKQNEVDLEAAMNNFDEIVKKYEAEIDQILQKTGSDVPVSVEATPQPETKQEAPKEEIITPNNSGVKVRMQEEFDDMAEDETQEVPYKVR